MPSRTADFTVRIVDDDGQADQTVAVIDGITDLSPVEGDTLVFRNGLWVNEPPSSDDILARASSTVVQSGVTTVVDRTMSSITFDVTDKPVIVRYEETYLASATNTIIAIVEICDAANAVKAQGLSYIALAGGVTQAFARSRCRFRRHGGVPRCMSRPPEMPSNRGR